MGIIWLDEVDSTNNYIKARKGEIPPFALVAARSQTAGRGQRGNSWESEPGRNFIFSFRFSPEGIDPSEQFVISEAAALVMAALLRDYGIEAKIKWPNDIYVGNRKICGILIENSLMGRSIVDAVVGIGLNVNQDLFRSDAPNPVSMRQLTGREYDLDEIGERISQKIEEYFGKLLKGDKGSLEGIRKEYHEGLYRNDGGYYRYRDMVSGEEFEARIDGVEADGLMRLVLRGGAMRRYEFKQVRFLL